MYIYKYVQYKYLPAESMHLKGRIFFLLCSALSAQNIEHSLAQSQ